MNYILPVLAVLGGFLFVSAVRPERHRSLRLLLAFSGAFLLSLTVFSLLPELYENGDAAQTGVFIMLGILLQIFLEFFSKGAEHGHVHVHSHNRAFPWVIFLSLCIHALLEGFPVYGHHTLVYGIVVHKFPIAIILTTFFLRSGMGRGRVFFFLFLFSLMTPLGTLLAEYLVFLETYDRQITAVVVGIFLHISTVILFESSEGHSFNLSKLLVILMGITVAYFL